MCVCMCICTRSELHSCQPLLASSTDLECELSHSVSDASDLVELHLLCHPNSTFATELQNKEERPTDLRLIEVTGQQHQLLVVC